MRSHNDRKRLKSVYALGSSVVWRNRAMSSSSIENTALERRKTVAKWRVQPIREFEPVKNGRPPARPKHPDESIKRLQAKSLVRAWFSQSLSNRVVKNVRNDTQAIAIPSFASVFIHGTSGLADLRCNFRLRSSSDERKKLTRIPLPEVALKKLHLFSVPIP